MKKTKILCFAAMIIVAGAGLVLPAAGGPSGKPAGSKPVANPKVTVTFDNALFTAGGSGPGDNVFQDKPYTGGTTNVTAEFQGYRVYLTATATGKTKRYILFRYPAADQAFLGCSPTTAPLFTPNDNFVSSNAWVEIWQLGAMQVGEVRAIGMAYYPYYSPAIRWMRSTLANPDCYHECSDMVVAYRQDLNHWQVATSLSRLELGSNAFGIFMKQPDGTFVPDVSGTYVYHPGDDSDPLSPDLVEPGDVAQLGETVATFQGNYHMRFKLSVYCPLNPPAPLTCDRWPCVLPNK